MQIEILNGILRFIIKNRQIPKNKIHEFNSLIKESAEIIGNGQITDKEQLKDLRDRTTAACEAAQKEEIIHLLIQALEILNLNIDKQLLQP